MSLSEAGDLLVRLQPYVKHLAGELVADGDGHDFLGYRVWCAWLGDECRRGVFVH